MKQIRSDLLKKNSQKNQSYSDATNISVLPESGSTAYDFHGWNKLEEVVVQQTTTVVDIHKRKERALLQELLSYQKTSGILYHIWEDAYQLTVF